MSTENENRTAKPETNTEDRLEFLGHPLTFGMPEWEKMEKEVCLYEDFGTKVVESPERTGKLCRLLSILMQGAMTPEEIHEKLTPALFMTVPMLIHRTFMKGMETENHENEGKIVDVTLQEIEKKDERGG